MPHWRQRRQQRLGNANPPSLPTSELEGEMEEEHQYFRQRKMLRNQPNYGAPNTEELEFGGLAKSILSGQQIAKYQLSAMRKKLGLPQAGSPQDRYTLAKLIIGDKSEYGISAHGTKVFLRVNPISGTHAEGDVFNQFAHQKLTSDTGTLFLDRPMCRPCGVSGAVTSMARQIGLKKLVIIEPGATMVLNL
jgi:MafB19-like deaminase